MMVGEHLLSIIVSWSGVFAMKWSIFVQLR